MNGKEHLKLILLAIVCCAGSLCPAQLNAQPQMPPNAPSGYGTELLGDAIVQYDEDMGTIIVIADEDTNNQIAQIVDTLDRPIPQVLIKVLFLEITHTDGSDIGVEGIYEYGSEQTIDTIESIFGLALESRGFFYEIIEEDFEIFIRAIAASTELEVLSRPSILTRNNEEATILVGSEFPFITNSRITDTGQTINTIEYEDIGISLTVVPHITPDRLVEMDVYPEISTLTGETVPISDTVNAPVIAKRSAETRVVVDDGKTVVIGGMLQDIETENVTKIPILGDIPLLGVLFRRTIKAKQKTELLIFLTPYVVANPQELRDLSIREKNEMTLTPKGFTEEEQEKFIDNL